MPDLDPACPVRDDRSHCKHFQDGEPCCACNDPTGPDPKPQPPVWLLDIDGVINAISHEGDRNMWPREAWLHEEAHSADGVNWPMLAARPVLDFLTEVHTGGHAEIRWHTTWQAAALNVGKALRLPEFPVQDCPEFEAARSAFIGGQRYTSQAWWKLGAAERVLGEEHRPLIWTDDDARWSLNADQVEAVHRLGRVLIVAPPTHTGLTPKNLRQIREFLGMDLHNAVKPQAKAAA